MISNWIVPLKDVPAAGALSVCAHMSIVVIIVLLLQQLHKEQGQPTRTNNLSGDRQRSRIFVV